MKILFCTHTKRPKIIIFKHMSQHSKTLTFVHTLYLIDFQCVLKALQKKSKKKPKKLYVVLKKCIPLQCFNKQMIVLQI